MTSNTRFVIFDRLGKQLVEIEPDVQNVSWLLNEEGQVPFSMPYTDAKTTPTNLQFGNRLLVQFGSGLPDWGGVIDTPRNRTSTGVNVIAYSAERILKWRRTTKNLTFGAAVPGTIFQSIIDTMNGISPSGIEIGIIFTGGDARTYEFHYGRIFDQVVKLARDSGNDFSIIPVLSGGILTFQANWHEQRGVNRASDALLEEGTNAGEFSFDESGEIANRFYAVGAGSTWGDERPVGIEDDAISQGEFDFRESSSTETAVSGIATLEANAGVAVTELANPRTRLSLVAINKEPGLYADYDIGDVVQVRGNLKGGDAWGIVSNYRLRSRQWNSNNTVNCVLEEA